MNMTKSKPTLSKEEAAEKDRLKSLLALHKGAWEERQGEKLSQERLGEIVGQMIGGKPMGQGAIWQYLNKGHKTKLNADFVQAVASLLGFDVAEVSSRFLPKDFTPEQTATTPTIDYDKVVSFVESGLGDYCVNYKGADMNPEMQPGFTLTVSPSVPIEDTADLQPTVWWAYNRLHVGFYEKRDITRLSFSNPVVPPMQLPDDAIYCGAVKTVMFNY